MDIALDPKLEVFAQEQVQAGEYGSVSEVVNEALALLRGQHELDFIDALSPAALVEVRAKLQDGIDSLDDGKGGVWNKEEIKAEGRRLLTERQEADY